jgi:hypothetical protein
LDRFLSRGGLGKSGCPLPLPRVARPHRSSGSAAGNTAALASMNASIPAARCSAQPPILIQQGGFFPNPRRRIVPKNSSVLRASCSRMSSWRISWFVDRTLGSSLLSTPPFCGRFPGSVDEKPTK